MIARYEKKILKQDVFDSRTNKRVKSLEKKVEKLQKKDQKLEELEAKK